MKTVTSIFILFLSLCYGKVLGQDTLSVATPQHIAQAILQKLDHDVSLTNKQRTEVYALLLERSEMFGQIKRSNSGKSLVKSNFQQANKQALGKLKQVLTTEQFKTLQALRQETQRQKAAYREDELYKSVQDIELDF